MWCGRSFPGTFCGNVACLPTAARGVGPGSFARVEGRSGSAAAAIGVAIVRATSSEEIWPIGLAAGEISARPGSGDAPVFWK